MNNLRIISIKLVNYARMTSIGVMMGNVNLIKVVTQRTYKTMSYNLDLFYHSVRR